MRLTLIVLIVLLGSVCGSTIIKRSAGDARCDALAGTIPVDEVTCDALFYRFTYVKDSNSCVKFVYGGCGGTINNFRTKGDCERVCQQ